MKIRINDLARELEVKAKAILDVLQEVGVTEKKTHSSSIEEDEAEKVRKHLSAKSGSASREKAASSEVKPKIDLSKISKPGDVMKLLQQREQQQRQPFAPPKPAAVTSAPPAPAATVTKPHAPVAPPATEKPAVAATKPAAVATERSVVVTPPAVKPAAAAPPVVVTHPSSEKHASEKHATEKHASPPAVVVMPPPHPPVKANLSRPSRR